MGRTEPCWLVPERQWRLRSDLTAAGKSRVAIDGIVRSGAAVPCFRGVLLPEHATGDLWQRCGAALSTQHAAAMIGRLNDTLLTVMKQASEIRQDGRYRLLEPIIRSSFDLPTMIRIAVGPSWGSLSADESGPAAFPGFPGAPASVRGSRETTASTRGCRDV